MKLFGTDGVRGTVGDARINPLVICQLGWALGRVLQAQGVEGAVLIGKDTRVSGYMLESALESGLIASGMDCLLLGPMPTPAVAYLTRTLRASAGVVISASHNPYQDNGLKFFDTHGRKLENAMERAIEAEVAKALTCVPSCSLGRASRLADARGRYIEWCKSKLSWPASLRGIKLVLDCAHGATYNIAPDVFNELGAKVVVTHAQPDGLNINAGCGSTDCASLQQAVVDHKADLGIAFDGDGDRCLLVDHTGYALDGDDLVWILAKHRLSQGQSLPGVAGTLMTNQGLVLALAELGCAVVRTAVGDKHIMQALEARQWPLGGESSGHIIDRDYMISGDGIVTALRVLEAMREHQATLQELRSAWQRLPHLQTNLVVSAAKAESLRQNPAALEALSKTSDGDVGQRVLVRVSGTESVVRLLVEGPDEAWVVQTTARVRDALERQCGH